MMLPIEHAAGDRRRGACAGGCPGSLAHMGRHPYNKSSAVVLLNRPDGIAVMALFSKYLEQGRRVGKWGHGGCTGRKTAWHWVS